MATIRITLGTIRALPHVAARYVRETGEYRITLQGLPTARAEAVACYTCDAADAVGTARAMSAHAASHGGR